MAKRNILVITYWSFDDALIQAYTLPYVGIMRLRPTVGHIHLLTLERSIDKVGSSRMAASSVQTSGAGVRWLPLKYHRFGGVALLKWAGVIPYLVYYILHHRINVLHAWCTPAGSIGWLLSILTGRDLVIDSYEPHAEAMVENGSWRRGGLAHRLLFWLEKRQTRRARSIIGVTSSMRDYALLRYGVTLLNMHVKPACIDTELFSFSKRKNALLAAELGLSGKCVAVYAGKFGGIYLDVEVFAFFHRSYLRWRDRFRAILLTSHPKEEVESLARAAGLPDGVLIVLRVPHSSMPDYIGLGDFALTPVKPVPTKRHCTPIKNGEYWAMGLPVVIPENISDDSEIIEKNGAGVILKEFTDRSYDDALETLDALLCDKSLPKRIRALAEQYRSFDIARGVYTNIYQ